MNASQSSRPSAQTVGELDVHLGYLRDDVKFILGALPNMATKKDIQELEERMAAFATKEQLSALEARMLRESVASTFDRWMSFITKAGAAAAVLVALAGGIAALVHFLDRVPVKP